MPISWILIDLAGLAISATRELTGGSITIYADRVAKRFERVHPCVRKIALAYVLAHELAHAMQGIGRHSDTGIMKAHWPDQDLLAMMFRKLKFTDHEVLLIRRGIEQRLAKQISARAKTERQ